jgi:hypothetical protein
LPTDAQELPLGLYNEAGYVLRDVPHAVWSGSGALTYMKRIGARNEYILRRGNAEVVLSRDWPGAMVWPLPPDR